MSNEFEYVITEDGRRIATAPTEAKARSIIREMRKTLPTYINFKFEVEKRQSTTAK